MTRDENDRPRSGSSYRPDPAFIERLEDDSLWQEDASRPIRRTDRYANRRTDRHASRGRRTGESDRGGRPGSSRPLPRSRRMAVIVFVVVAVVLLVAGLALNDSSGSSGTTPFSLLPLDSSGVTATSAASETSVTVPVSTEPVGSTTTSPPTTTTP
jgi:hypothetical protein